MSAEILSLGELQIHLPEGVRDHLSAQCGDALLSSILERMTQSPADTCCRVNLLKSSVDEVMDALREYVIESRERRCVHRFSVKRHDVFKDLVLVRAESSDSRSTSGSWYHRRGPPNPEGKDIFPRWLKRTELGWPVSHRAVVVDRFCGEAVLRGADIFVKGVISADSGLSSDEDVAVYADIRAPSVKSIARGLVLEKYSGQCVFLGVGTLCCERAELFSRNSGVGVRMGRIAGPPQPSLNGILSTQHMLQNLPSVAVAHALEPRPGDVIMDMCCAPGGKTSHIASLVGNRGLIIACDKSRKKMLNTAALFQSMGATCIIPLALDSTKCVIDEDETKWRDVRSVVDCAAIGEDGLLDVKGFHVDSFDRILLDPPCSALGLRPKLYVEARSARHLKKYAEYQKRFVEAAVKLLKRGGTLVYSTCTINADENEDMVSFILSQYDCMQLVPLPDNFPGGRGLPNRGLSDEQRSNIRRFDPTADINTMGFFIALFQKVD